MINKQAAGKWRLKKGDTVMVITGRDKGKIGNIIKIIRSDKKIIIKGVNSVKRHTRPSSNQPSGIIEKEMPIHASNVMHIDPKDNKPTRIGIKILEDGQRLRYSKRSKEYIERSTDSIAISNDRVRS